MKNWFKGIRGQIILVILVVLIPAYILNIVSAWKYVSTMHQQVISNADSILDLNMKSFEADIERLNEFIYNLQNEDEDYVALDNSQIWDAVHVYMVNKQLYEQVSNQQYDQALFVYFEGMDQVLLQSDDSLREYQEAMIDMVQSEEFSGIINRWTIVELEDRDYLFHVSGYYRTYSGSFIDLTAIEAQLGGLLDFEDCSFSFDNLEMVSDRAGYYTITKSLEHTKIFLHVSVSEKEIRRNIPTSGRLIFIFSLGVVLIIPLMTYLLGRMIVDPVSRIVEAHNELSQGNSDYRISDMSGTEEFKTLKSSFNNMADEIKDLKIDSYEKELENERMALKNLILQVHPHFVLNIFNQIYSMAQLKEYENIKFLSLYLTKYFRYLFKQGVVSTIEDEVNLAMIYAESMEIRYPDCFEVEWDIDRDTMSYRIPSMTLHNIVENVFKYALVDGGYITIKVSSYKEGDFTVLSVEDDGLGMKPEILNSINAGEKVVKEDREHIGLWNCTYRVKKFCGEDSCIKVESVLTEGTKVSVYLAHNGKHLEEL